MFFFKVCITMTLLEIANAVCRSTSWTRSFDSAGQSKCDSVDFFMRGLQRSDQLWYDEISQLDGVQCCSASPKWSKSEPQVIYADWSDLWDGYNVWVNCPAGYFLQGLQRSSSGWPWYSGYLHHIDYGRCAKPSHHPFYHGDCYDKNIDFSYSGIFTCNTDYFITGMYKGDCRYLYCIKALRCCKMSDTSEIIDDAETFKTKIMDTTLFNLANVADRLGYGWCGGEKGDDVGEDFYKDGDSWIADATPFKPKTECEGFKCDERLKIDYLGWNLAVKNIIYGNSIIDSLQPEVVNTGREVNNMDVSSTRSFEYSTIFTDTVQHSSTSSWKTSLQLSFSLQAATPGAAKVSAGVNVAFDYSKSDTDTSTEVKSQTTKITTVQTIPPHSAANYTVKVLKTRTTNPYTAVIIAKFNVRFRGFLRWGGGYGNPLTNYHYQYRGSGARPSFPYTFGSQSDAFYKALKRQNITKSRPWMWNDMIKNYPSVLHVFNRLTDESQYEFTLRGKLEHVASRNIIVIWNKTRLNRRSVVDTINSTTHHIGNITFIARVGPNDKPVDVKYPEVVLDNAEPFKLETIPLNPDFN